ncbi:unnamed protein product [Ixodes persulcatus]
MKEREGESLPIVYESPSTWKVALLHFLKWRGSLRSDIATSQKPPLFSTMACRRDETRTFRVFSHASRCTEQRRLGRRSVQDCQQVARLPLARRTKVGRASRQLRGIGVRETLSARSPLVSGRGLGRRLRRNSESEGKKKAHLLAFRLGVT